MQVNIPVPWILWASFRPWSWSLTIFSKNIEGFSLPLFITFSKRHVFLLKQTQQNAPKNPIGFHRCYIYLHLVDFYSRCRLYTIHGSYWEWSTFRNAVFPWNPKLSAEFFLLFGKVFPSWHWIQLFTGYCTTHLIAKNYPKHSMYGTFTIIYLHLSISLLVVGFNPFETY